MHREKNPGLFLGFGANREMVNINRREVSARPVPGQPQFASEAAAKYNYSSYSGNGASERRLPLLKRSRGPDSLMRIWMLIGLAVIAAAAFGCANARESGRLQSVSTTGRPFGGTPSIDIPPSAYAMGAYLKAQMAAENGQRAEALKNYESAVRYDPHNAALHVQLADLYVGSGKLKEALSQATAAGTRA